MSQKRCKIWPRLLWQTNRRMHFRLAPKLMTLNCYKFKFSGNFALLQVFGRRLKQLQTSPAAATGLPRSVYKQEIARRHTSSTIYTMATLYRILPSVGWTKGAIQGLIWIAIMNHSWQFPSWSWCLVLTPLCYILVFVISDECSVSFVKMHCKNWRYLSNDKWCCPVIWCGIMHNLYAQKLTSNTIKAEN